MYNTDVLIDFDYYYYYYYYYLLGLKLLFVYKLKSCNKILLSFYYFKSSGPFILNGIDLMEWLIPFPFIK